MAGIVGRTYIERGEPVEVLVQWSQGSAMAPFGLALPEAGWEVNVTWLGKHVRGGPRNVLIRRANGDLIVRPFRGLRRVLSPNPRRDAPHPCPPCGDGDPLR